MAVIESHVDTVGAEFRENRAHMDGAGGRTCARGWPRSRAGGGEEAVKRQREQGKLLARERVERLLDPGTPFLEIGALAAYGLYDGAAPGRRPGHRASGGCAAARSWWWPTTPP